MRQYPQKRSSRVALKHLALLLALLAVVLLSALFWGDSQHAKVQSRVVSNAAELSDSVGELGGVPVALPSVLIKFLEYDDDPHFTDQRNVDVKAKNYQRKIRSFGFWITWFDVDGLSTAEGMQGERPMYVGVVSNSHYGGDSFAAGLADGIQKKFQRPYARSDEEIGGLEHYVPVYEPGEKERQGYSSFRDRDIYLYRNSAGIVKTYIECLNDPAERTLCSMSFVLTPEIKASIVVNFRRANLRHWKKINSAVKQKITSFRINLKNNS